MIVKILPPSRTFSGVKYNTGKIDRNSGELMKVANFGPLQAFGHLKPQDYINYLTALSALNKNVKLPQFHAVISAKGKTYDKTALTAIAERWMLEMGYGSQPYLIVSHHDTGNNHVHIVSCRIDKNGAKINSAFEFVRAQRSLSKALGYDFAMQYTFSTRAQFFMLLENGNYFGKDPDEQKLNEKISGFQLNRQRAAEINLLFQQYKNQACFRTLVKERHHIDLVFHAADGKRPYGYSIIDHPEKLVFKGSEVMALKELLAAADDRFETDNKQAEKMYTGPVASIQSISIADDVDDQQIHGMRRRRQKKARTNTR